MYAYYIIPRFGGILFFSNSSHQLSQLCKIVDKVDIDERAAVDRIKQEIKRLKKKISSLGGHAATAKIAEIMPDIDVYACAKYILKEGTREEKRDLLLHIKTEFKILNGEIVTR